MILSESKDYIVELEEEDGQRFLHLTVFNFNKTVFKDIRKQFLDYLLDCFEEGYEIVSFYLPVGKSMKFHNMIKPVDYCLDITTPKGPYKVAGWYTKEI